MLGVCDSSALSSELLLFFYHYIKVISILRRMVSHVNQYPVSPLSLIEAVPLL